MKIGKEKPPYLSKVAYVQLHTAGKTTRDYQQKLRGEGAVSMKKNHCRNKWEVLQQVQQKKRQEARKPETVIASRLRTINQLRPIIEKAREKMREENL